MKEYKIIRQKESMLRSTDDDFENELNGLALEGWQVISSCMTDMNGFKVILERTKNR